MFYHYVYVLKLLSGFFSENRLATLVLVRASFITSPWCLLPSWQPWSWSG